VSELKNHSAEMGWLMAGLNIPTHTPTLYFIPYCMTLCGYHQYGMLIAPYLVVQTVHHILWYKQYTILAITEPDGGYVSHHANTVLSRASAHGRLQLKHQNLGVGGYMEVLK